MKKLLFVLTFVLIGFSAYCSNEYKIETIKFEQSPLEMKCVDATVGVSVLFAYVEVTVKICCWRTSAHSPKYDCSWEVLGRSNSPDKGYIDIETIDSRVLNDINVNGLTKITIDTVLVVIEGGESIRVVGREYNIESDENGRFIQVDLIINPT